MKFSKEEKAMWLVDWKQGGKSAWAYANENGLCPQTFIRWTKDSMEEKRELVDITKSVITGIRPEPEILIERGDIKIHIPLEPIKQELHTVIKMLGQSI